MARERTIPDLTPDLARLAAKLLSIASDSFGNHGCNDFDLAEIPGFETRAARAALDLAEHTWNGDPKEHDPERDHRYAADFALMGFLAAILEKAAGETPKKGDAKQRTIKIQNATSAATDAAREAASAAHELLDAKDRAAASLVTLRAEVARLEALIK